MLFPTVRTAEDCRAFLAARDVSSRVVQFIMPGASRNAQVFAVLFPKDNFDVSKQFWQHTGLGISSRRAEHCLNLLASHTTPELSGKAANKHYGTKPPRGRGVPIAPSISANISEEESFEHDQALFLEERYGRNLSAQAAEEAGHALRRRIAGILVRDESGEVEVGVSVRGASVREDDVYLYPAGMAAIWSSHQLALGALGSRKSICFGYVLE
jgi:cystathionine gamma-synthase